MTGCDVSPSASANHLLKSLQLRAVLAANSELIAFYRHIGQSIVSLQTTNRWETAVVEQLAADLRSEHPGIQGFSRTSLFAMRQMYLCILTRGDQDGEKNFKCAAYESKSA